MPETIADTVDSEIAPWLYHFGEIGVAPDVHRIVDVWEDPDFVNDVEGIPDELRNRTNVQFEVSYIDGERWSDYLAREPAAALVETAEQIGWNAGYIGARGVAHRDLHVDNIWIDGDGSPVVTDWDLAFAEEDVSGDLDDLKKTTEKVLAENGRDGMYDSLEQTYLTGARQGVRAERQTPVEAIENGYSRLVNAYKT